MSEPIAAGTQINDAGRSASANANAAAAPGLAQFISFKIGDETYGVDIMAVREIKGWTEITQLPEQPDFVRGVLNLRGVIVPIVDLRCRFGLGSTEATSLHVMIIASIDQSLVGLLADNVSDIIAIEPATIKPIPRVSPSKHSVFLKGLATIDTDMIAIIELDALLGEHARMTGNEFAKIVPQ
ncbi:chemotaxis protein CheW [Rhodoplanes sp. Z2-YC6860]|uniref:chemotaxis protein CheW n=1 Tax=Rhodoplanes sp. Z2-YC6860 TaxID=674703 RepID=UPI00078E03A3|nr:chemotaxis protein CheW [Rhodoplanes sp. Z2-YC6860]AMN44763.1 chemotaxis protein CheW [Rhodoplanes sp. Z2-YC6860]